MNGLDLSPHTRAGPGLRRNSGTVLFGFFWFQINWGCCCKRLARFWLPVIALWYFRGLVWLLEVSTDALSLSIEIKTWPSVFIDEHNLILLITPYSDYFDCHQSQITACWLDFLVISSPLHIVWIAMTQPAHVFCCLFLCINPMPHGCCLNGLLQLPCCQ